MAALQGGMEVCDKGAFVSQAAMSLRFEVRKCALSHLGGEEFSREDRRVPDACLTDLIRLACKGDEVALHHVFDMAYEDLRGLARMRLSRSNRGTLLDTTSLVHESFLRFANAGELKITDRQHFIRYAATVMRSVIVDFVRQSAAERRGGGTPHLTLNTHIGDTREAESEILRVHEALDELAQYDKRLVQVVEMRYFAGMTEQEIADTLGITDRTVRRDWEKARLLLAEALADA
jgi:RNA polymerase sigma factor (TIGR02999 family)